MIRRICCVPSKMSRIFASRAHFSSSSSSPYPALPQSATQRRAISTHARPALAFAQGRLQRVRLWSCRPSTRPGGSAGAPPRSPPRGRGARRRPRSARARARVVHLDPGFGEQLPGALDAGARDPDGHPGDQGRVLSNVCIALANDFFVSISGLPSRFSFGTRQFSSRKVAVSEALMPSLWSSRSRIRPGFERSTTNDLIAARPWSGRARPRRPPGRRARRP